MKNILYKILPVCLLTIGLTGCEDETKYRPLPEAVPLTMSINEKAFVMGEHLKVDIKVEPDADGNEVVANEDFDIYFTAKAGTEDVANVFEPFSSLVTFPKGEKQIQVDFPVKTSGLVGTTTMEFVAFARGYKMANSSQGIKVSDYYRISMSLENNTENVVTEGGKFVLVAKVDKPSSVPLEVTITPKEGEEGRYDNLPSTLTIPAGRTSVKSAAVTIKQDYEMTGDLQLVLNLKSNSSSNPMTAPALTITMTDLESMADPDLYDMTTVYENPNIMFVSYDDDWFTGKETAKMDEGTAHPNAELGSQWKFDYAIEFHKNSTSGDYQKLGNATDANRGNVLKIDWIKYAKVTDEGELNICVGVEGTNYGTAGIHCCKSLGQMWAQNVTRIYPGMRIMEKMAVKIGGGCNHRIGLFDMILLKDNHVDFAGGIHNAVSRAKEYCKAKGKDLKIELEVRNFDELNQALAEGVDRIMFDNFTPEDTRKAVEIVGGRCETESSGGITYDTMLPYAQAGVDFISFGALTHSVKGLDMSFKAC